MLPSGNLEQNILDLATEKLNHLESMVKDPYDGIEVTDIHSLFSELSGLRQLREMDEHGLSERVVRGLNQIDARALYIMGQNKNTRDTSS